MDDHAALRQDTSHSRELRVPGGQAKQPNAARTELSTSIQDALKLIDQELGTTYWWLKDPERRKALSRAREFLQRMLGGLDHEYTTEALLPAKLLVDRAAQHAPRHGRENAWDFAEELRAMSFAFLPDEALALLLEKESADTSPVNYPKLSGRPFPKELLAYPFPRFRASALALLRWLHDQRVDRVRHDRARDKLWQLFVLKLIPIVAILLCACLALYAQDEGSKLLPVLAGALGSELSAVLSLRDSEQRIRHLRRSSSFLTLQPMIGATAALAMQWLGAHELLQLGQGNHDARVIVGFLAGFSEPFFLGTLRRLGEIGTAPPPKNDSAAKSE